MKMEVSELRMVDIHYDDDFNCRGVIPPIDVVDLAKDIQRRGLIQPITVLTYDEAKQKETGKLYKLLAGFRRFVAFKVNKSDTIPAIVRTDIIDEAEARIFNLSENVQRKELNILQEAQAIQKLKELGVNEFVVAEKLGKSRGWVQVRYMLLGLPPEIKKEVAAGFISQTQIRDLYTIRKNKGEAECFEAAKKIKTAKEKGERPVAIKPVNESKTIKKHRQRVEIFAMMEHIQGVTGNGLHTRCLAWCAGEINSQELYESLLDYADKNGIAYNIPN